MRMKMTSGATALAMTAAFVLAVLALAWSFDREVPSTVSAVGVVPDGSGHPEEIGDSDASVHVKGLPDVSEREPLVVGVSKPGMVPQSPINASSEPRIDSEGAEGEQGLDRLVELRDGLRAEVEALQGEAFEMMWSQGRHKVVQGLSTKDQYNSSGLLAPNQAKFLPSGEVHVIVLEDQEYPELCATYRQLRDVEKELRAAVGGE